MTKLTLLAASMLFVAGACVNAGDGDGEGRKRKDRGEKGGQMCGARGGMERGHRGGAGRMMKDLDLSEEQKEQMKKIHESKGDQMKELAKALRESQKSLREAAEGDDITEAKISELSKNLANNIAAMAIFRAQMKKDMDAILTDEQKAKMKTKMEERRAKMKERMEKRKGKKHGNGDDDKRKRRRKGDNDADHTE